MQSTTPDDVHIQPRNCAHDITAALTGNWLNGNPFLTTFFNSMSIFFPVGEKFFIDSVRYYRDQITDPALKKDVRGFCGQEGFHRREHQHYNETLCAARGYELAALESSIHKLVDMANKKFSPIERLAATITVEHLTSIMAQQILNKNSFMDTADPAMAALWRWHSAEEIEHKAVAFDVFKAVGGSEKVLRRITRRTSFLVAREMLRCFCLMLKKDGILFSLKSWRQGCKDLFGANGILIGTMSLYTDIYQPGFHPWQQDSRALLSEWALKENLRKNQAPYHDHRTDQGKLAVNAALTS